MKVAKWHYYFSILYRTTEPKHTAYRKLQKPFTKMPKKSSTLKQWNQIYQVNSCIHIRFSIEKLHEEEKSSPESMVNLLSANPSSPL